MISTSLFHDFFSRKLFEPQKFPKNTDVSHIFRKYFFKNPVFSTQLLSPILEEFKNQVKPSISCLLIFCLKIHLQICAVGWEPNPATTEYLKKLEASYKRCGFRVKINTETGVGIQNSELKFIRMSQVNDQKGKVSNSNGCAF